MAVTRYKKAVRFLIYDKSSGKVYRLVRQGRVLYEKGYIRLKDGDELDSQGRRTGRRYKLY